MEIFTEYVVNQINRTCFQILYFTIDSIEDDLDKLLMMDPKSTEKQTSSKPVVPKKPAIGEKPKNLPPKPGTSGCHGSFTFQETDSDSDPDPIPVVGS